MKDPSMMTSGKLKLTTPSDREVEMSRTFDAPKRLVWKAYTTPELVRRWLLGPPGWTMPVCEIDLRVGGSYRFVWKEESGDVEMGMGGVYREVTPTDRIVATQKFDQSWYPGDALDTVTFVELDGKTTMTTIVLYESKESRDTALATGMKEGVEAGYDRLEELLPTIEE